MLNLNVSATFKKDRRRCVKRGYDMGLLAAVVDTLLIPALPFPWHFCALKIATSSTSGQVPPGPEHIREAGRG